MIQAQYCNDECVGGISISVCTCLFNLTSGAFPVRHAENLLVKIPRGIFGVFDIKFGVSDIE